MEVERRQNISFWIATELLAEEGCIVETANDGVACVDMIEKADADYYKMILMDIQMPVMNGQSVFQSLKTVQSHHLSFGPHLVVRELVVQFHRLNCGQLSVVLQLAVQFH